MEVRCATDPGAPYAYLPMSLQQPLATNTILARQREIEGNAWSWKLHQSIEVPSPEDDATDTTPRASPCMDGAADLDGVLGPEETPAPCPLSIPNDTPPMMTKAFRDAMQMACMDGTGGMSQVPNPPCTIKTSDTHPIHVSPILPPSMVPMLSEHVLKHLPREYAELAQVAPGRSDTPLPRSSWGYLQRGEPIPPGEFASHLVHALGEPEEHLTGQVRGEQLIRLPPTVSLDELARTVEPCKESPETMAESAQRPHQIGNMILSSCPGKKVRMNAPVRGRSSVCRDLKMDLVRYRAMGVRAIVCCLDDDELTLLGSPCAEYMDEVASQGLDLVRLPIAEGFAPTDLVKFDIMITALILTYTLRGSSILVHCRGGVGRAGLVAAIWTLKMGFVMPSAAPVPLDVSLASAAREAQNDSASVLQTVLKLIEVVRRRRSLRAIETAEQAHFLMEYVRFIHRQEHARRCFERCSM